MAAAPALTGEKLVRERLLRGDSASVLAVPPSHPLRLLSAPRPAVASDRSQSAVLRDRVRALAVTLDPGTELDPVLEDFLVEEGKIFLRETLLRADDLRRLRETCQARRSKTAVDLAAAKRAAADQAARAGAQQGLLSAAHVATVSPAAQLGLGVRSQAWVSGGADAAARLAARPGASASSAASTAKDLGEVSRSLLLQDVDLSVALRQPSLVGREYFVQRAPDLDAMKRIDHERALLLRAHGSTLLERARQVVGAQEGFDDGFGDGSGFDGLVGGGGDDEDDEDDGSGLGRRSRARRGYDDEGDDEEGGSGGEAEDGEEAARVPPSAVAPNPVAAVAQPVSRMAGATLVPGAPFGLPVLNVGALGISNILGAGLASTTALPLSLAPLPAEPGLAGLAAAASAAAPSTTKTRTSARAPHKKRSRANDSEEEDEDDEYSEEDDEEDEEDEDEDDDDDDSEFGGKSRKRKNRKGGK